MSGISAGILTDRALILTPVVTISSNSGAQNVTIPADSTGHWIWCKVRHASGSVSNGEGDVWDTEIINVLARPNDLLVTQSWLRVRGKLYYIDDVDRYERDRVNIRCVKVDEK